MTDNLENNDNEQQTPKNTNMKWYVLHAYSGFEKTVMRNLKEQIVRHNLQDKFGEILVPVEKVEEIKNGKKSTSELKFFPGYVLVEMELTENTWYFVKSLPKVSGFVGGVGNKPTPLPQKEVEKILNQMQEGKPRPKVQFEVGETIRIKEGAFNDFPGTVENVNYEKSIVTVSVSIFGRTTPVEVKFENIEKA